MNAETFAADRSAAQDAAIEDLEPAVAAALEQREADPETDDWAAEVVLVATLVYATAWAAETDVAVDQAAASAFGDLVRLKLVEAGFDENRQAQTDRLALWLGVAAINAAVAGAAVADTSVLAVEWVTMRDESVREIHRDVAGQRRTRGQTFDVAGWQLDYPGQPVGPPEVWIECRCSLRIVREENQMTDTLTAAVDADYAGGMVALKPADAQGIAVEGGDSPEELHVTLFFLGDDVSPWPPDMVAAVQQAGAAAAKYLPITARVAGVGQLGDANPKATVLFLNGENLAEARAQVFAELAEWDEGPPSFPAQHEPFIAHLTLGYGLDPNDHADMIGREITLDRIDVHLGGDVTTHQLEADEPAVEDEAVVAAVEEGLEPVEEPVVAALPWHGVLAPEGVWSGDRRQFVPDALRWRDLPLPLAWQHENAEGHDGAVVIGRIDRIWREDNLIKAEGVFDESEEADRVVGQLAEGMIRGVSVDVDDAEFEFDGEAEDRIRISGRICAATVCAIPAFAEAFVAIGEWADGEQCPEGQHRMPDGSCMPDEDMGDVAYSAAPDEFAISETPWDGSSSRFTDDEWFRSTIVHTNGDSRVKSDNKMPILEPNGDLSRAGVHNAAARVDQVDASPEQIASAKRSLRGAYERLGEDPPESLTAAAFRRGPGWVTHPTETRRLHTYWTSGVGAAKIRWGTEGSFRRCQRELGEYLEPRFLNSTCAEWYHDATGRWPGRQRGDLASVEGGVAFNLDAGEALVAALSPAEWFADPQLEGPTPATLTECGHYFGHLATWDTCHVGFPGVCKTAPHSVVDYAYFHTGVVMTAGGEVPVGQITLGTGHAGLRLNSTDTMAHYDNTGAAVADVVVGEDEHGIWFSGALRSNVDDQTVHDLRAAGLSGDWRKIRGNLELVAALAVNVPGFPVPRAGAGVRGGEQASLVASGVVVPELEPSPPGTRDQAGLSVEQKAEVAGEVRRMLRAEKLRQKVRGLRAAALRSRIGQ